MAQSQPTAQKWNDLGLRIVSAGVIGVIALAALFIGPLAWSLLVLIVYVLMLRELAGLCEPGMGARRRWLLALTPVAVLLVALALPVVGGADPAGFDGIWTAYRLGLLRVLLVALVPIGIGVLVVKNDQRIWLAYGVVLAGAAMALIYGQIIAGPEGILVLVGIVMISDIAGYFAGRALGGPKFWPRISPKKTWSGTIAGWIGAGVFGAIFLPQIGGLSPGIAGAVAVLLAFAGQMGDITESWIKRRAGVKDSSKLIPGHGGVLDRLDALVAVAALAGLASLLTGAWG